MCYFFIFCFHYDACLSCCCFLCVSCACDCCDACLYACASSVYLCVHACVGLWMMTLLWDCAGSCPNPQTPLTSGAGPCPWSHLTMRVRHTEAKFMVTRMVLIILNKPNGKKWASCLPVLGEGYFTSLLEELEYEGREFEADSWSMAVDSAYLQTHRKDVIKRQDVIYG